MDQVIKLLHTKNYLFYLYNLLNFCELVYVGYFGIKVVIYKIKKDFLEANSYFFIS